MALHGLPPAPDEPGRAWSWGADAVRGLCGAAGGGVIFATVCSGIEAASVAWNPLGWRARFFSEIEPFPCAVLAHHYSTVPNRGDMLKFKDWPDATIDVLAGGTPCQSFSVAGLRKGLDDPRGNLMLTFGAVAAKYRPRWLVWENVPGVLSSNGGRDFGSFLGLLGVLGYGFAYRVLDAQYFGLAQRRKRVFVVGCLGDWRSAAAVLFERESLCGHPAPRREAREGTAGRAARSIAIRGRDGTPQAELGDELANALLTPNGGRGGVGVGAVLAPERARALTTSNQRIDAETETFVVTHALTGEGFDASEDGTGRGTPLVPVVAGTLRARHNMNTCEDAMGGGLLPVAFDTTQITSKANYSSPKAGDPCHPLAAGAHAPAIAFGGQMSTVQTDVDLSQTLQRKNPQAAAVGMQVRRLTPRECERLQGFPDDYTLIPHRGKPAADGPRYKALGNSWAAPCAAWIGRRIALVDSIGGNEARAAV